MLARLGKSKYYQLVKPMARSINMARSIKETTRPHPGILQEAQIDVDKARLAARVRKEL
jgi:CHAD domain-containing protein